MEAGLGRPAGRRGDRQRAGRYTFNVRLSPPRAAKFQPWIFALPGTTTGHPVLGKSSRLPAITHLDARDDSPMGSGMDNDIMTIREVVEYLKLAEKTAYRMPPMVRPPASRLAGPSGSGAPRSTSGSSGSPPDKRSGEENNAGDECRCPESWWLCLGVFTFWQRPLSVV